MEGLRKKLPEGAFQSAIYALGIFPLLRTIPRRAAGRRWKERLQRWEQRLERWEQHFFKHWVKHPHPTMGYDWLTLHPQGARGRRRKNEATMSPGTAA
jgi:hypothetical protein